MSRHAIRGSIDAYLGDEEIEYEVHYYAGRDDASLVRVVRSHDGAEPPVEDFLAAYAADRSLLSPGAAERILLDRCWDDACERDAAAYEDHVEREAEMRRDR